MGIPILQISKLSPERETHTDRQAVAVRIPPSSMWLQSLLFLYYPQQQTGQDFTLQGGALSLWVPVSFRSGKPAALRLPLHRQLMYLQAGGKLL